MIPTYNDLSFYPNVEAGKERYTKILDGFKSTYNESPEFIARAPGRVNLIGDHIDYSYFSSLLMALEADVVAAVSTNDSGVVKVHNTNPKFPAQSFELPKNPKDLLQVTPENFTWAHYVKCGFLVAQKFLVESHPENVKSLKGMNIYIDGTVPTGGGLSSSAAISVASALLTLRAHGLTEITKNDLTKITIVSEHYLGLNNGGMDQTASIYGEPGQGLLYQFSPRLYGQMFPFPKVEPNDMVLLISNTLVESNKVESGPVNYNLRVVEIAVAAEYMARKYNLTPPNDSNLSTCTLRGVIDDYYQHTMGQDRWDGHDLDKGIERLSKGLEMVEESFTKEQQEKGFSTEEAAKELGLSVEEFTKKFLTKFPVRYDTLKLYKLAKHVYFDSLCVLKIAKLVQANSDNFLQDVGKIMNDSHESARVNCENTTEELDKVCEISLANGGYGARVTGAGFGGSAIHLSSTDKIDGLYKAIAEQYYHKKFPEITQEELEQALVITKPSAGASLVDISNL